MKSRIALLAAVAALFSSCLPVPFDLTLSQAAATARKMTRDNSALLTLAYGTDPSAQSFVFYPQILATGPDYTNGFVVSMQGLNFNIIAVQYNPQSGSYGSYGMQSQTIANPDPQAPSFLMWPTKTGPSYFLDYAFDAVDPKAGNQYAVIWGNPAGHTLTPVFANNMSSQIAVAFPNAVVLGASVSADPFGTYDMAHWLATQAGTYVEFSFQVNSAGLANPPNPTPRGALPYALSFVPDFITRVIYFYDENQLSDPARSPNRSFAAWWDSSSGSWVSYAWWEQPAGTFHNVRLPADHRLDALLSTGQLLSTEGGTGRLYDRDGNERAAFPLGNLVYIGEEYVGGVPRCYFSQCLIYDKKPHFNVYWIQTDQLGTLAK